ncbi:hypothetical protein NM688_g5658 [Phlebia brevispora]|uniref:Uncharacterized protein n=1 Tax=Phlebia brevispora TaxID=194682 RepID=A0ACC1SRZ2_9APHY|nr:hypothetical protein NM688_g5658 [Phlebia brevispora]
MMLRASELGCRLRLAGYRHRTRLIISIAQTLQKRSAYELRLSTRSHVFTNVIPARNNPPQDVYYGIVDCVDDKVAFWLGLLLGHTEKDIFDQSDKDMLWAIASAWEENGDQDECAESATYAPPPHVVPAGQQAWYVK